MTQNKKGLAIILSSPSGGGKSSIAKALLAEDSRLVLSISATTRNPRPGDEEGVHYFFKTRDDFLAMINNEELLEYSEIYGNLYGIPRDFVEEQLNQGRDVLFDIDYQGAYKLKTILKDLVLSIFILPPSIETLRSRLEARGQDSQEEIDFRITLAEEEKKKKKNYDYTVVNEDFAATLKAIKVLIEKERK